MELTEKLVNAYNVNHSLNSSCTLSENIVIKMHYVLINTRTGENTNAVIAFYEIIPPFGSLPAPLVGVRVGRLNKSQIVIQNTEIVFADIAVKLCKSYGIGTTKLYFTSYPVIQVITIALRFFII